MNDRIINEIREIGQMVIALLHRPIPNVDPKSTEWLDIFEHARKASFKVSLGDVRKLSIIYKDDLVMAFGIHSIFLELTQKPQIEYLPFAGLIGNN